MATAFTFSFFELLSSESDELDSSSAFLFVVVNGFVGEGLALLSFSSSELLSSEDELLVDFGFSSGCFDLLATGVSSSELLSSEELDSFTVGF